MAGRLQAVIRRAALVCVILAMAPPAAGDPAATVAAALPQPHVLTSETLEPVATYPLPVGPWQRSGLPVKELSGDLRLVTWRISGAELSSAAILARLREGLEAAGFVPVYDCEATRCGGFDFRFATRIAPEPEMHVNIADFRYLAAERAGPDGTAAEHVALIVSRSRQAGFVQMIHVSPLAGGGILPAPLPAPPPPQAIAAPTEPMAPSVPPIAEALRARAVVLEEVAFAPGSAAFDTDAGDETLASLAAYLDARPGEQLLIVGHTDATGALEANVALSRARAEAVRARLVSEHGADASRVLAEGVGFLAPRASNATAEGRAANRRVEVIALDPDE